jgi:hypothetical protein
MTHNRLTRTALLGLLLAGSAAPALAQETVTPPTIMPPAVETPTPAPAPAASPGITFAPQAPVVQQVPPPAPPPESVRNPAPEPGAAERSQPRRAAAAPVRRAAPVTTAVAPAASTAAPAAVAPAPSPEVTPPPVAPEASTTPVPAPAAETEEISSGAAWAMLGLVAAAVIGGIAFLIARRRRRRTEEDFVYDEPVVHEEPAYVPVEQPAVAAPMLTPAAVPVADEIAGRPWIDIGLRPVRADNALAVEVTVSNSGDAPAHDVRVSTWMLRGAHSPEGEAALIEARSGAQTATVTVSEGEDASVETSLALPESATPTLVAEARYPLPQGGEGRIAATFEIEMGDDALEARLHEVVERA